MVGKKFAMNIHAICHGPKLEHLKGFTIQSRSDLDENHRPTKLQGDENGKKNQERGEDEQTKQGKGYIEEAFEHGKLADVMM